MIEQDPLLICRPDEQDCELFQKLGKSPFDYALDVVGGKWNLRILYLLLNHKVLRYGQLKRELERITHKMLSSQLKQLEEYGIVIRTEYPQVPPKVEYSLTPRGQALEKVFESMAEWIMWDEEESDN